ncbi:hypothetical protein H4R19_007167, partial [Coemansia spiralis]
MGPPELPPLGSLSAPGDLPFWRPPRVLQREPHYNHRRHPVDGHISQRARDSWRGVAASGAPPSKESAPAGPSLSPALLAISNSHYRQQQEQPRPVSLPAIQSLLLPLPPEDGTACSVTTHADSARSSASSSTSVSARDSDPDASCHKRPRISVHVRGPHDDARCAVSPALPATGAAAGGSREPMSIASLVGTSGGSDLPHTVSLPGISSLAPPAGGRKRPHSEESAAAALHKMAHTTAAACAPGQHGVPQRTAALPPPAIREYPLCTSNQVVITCYHASVAQKS